MSLVDLTYIRDVAGGNKELMRELVGIFLSQLPEFERTLDEALAERRWIDVAAVAHKAKSSIVSMGMNDLGLLLKRLEMTCKNIWVGEVGDEVNAQRVSDCKMQLASMPQDMAQWVSQHSTLAFVELMIETYKQQAREACAELNNKEIE